jgi:hypothetical protein
MPRRSGLCACLLALAIVAVAACEDESPTLTGDPFFPGGARPVTREVILPASEFLTPIGAFTGYTRPSQTGFLLVAEDFEGTLDAHGLVGFRGSFPDSITYVQAGSQRTAGYVNGPGRLVMRVDSGATFPRSGAVTLRAWALTQRFDAPSATWTLAVDTGAVETPWTEAGGTRGALLGEATYSAVEPGDSVVLNLDSAEVAMLRDTTLGGLLLTTGTSGARVQISTSGLVLRTTAHPVGASPDTAIAQNLTPAQLTFVFTPEVPTPAGTFQVGGVRSARSLFTLDLDQPVPGCPPTETCGSVPLADVQVNRVSLLFRVLQPPPGFALLDSMAITLRAITEPELGRRAPLGEYAADRNPPGSLVRFFYHQPADSVVEIPITEYAARLAQGDTLPTSFALLSEGDLRGPVNFGLGVYELTPRLRIVYTLPSRPELP